MSTLSSSSTLAQVKAEYFDNASYTENDSVAEAKAFVTACRFLILMLPRRAVHGREEVELDVKLIQDEMGEAKGWLAAKSAASGSNVKFASLENFRD